MKAHVIVHVEDGRVVSVEAPQETEISVLVVDHDIEGMQNDEFTQGKMYAARLEYFTTEPEGYKDTVDNFSLTPEEIETDLGTIFEMQHTLNKRVLPYIVRWDWLDDDERVDWMRNFITALQQEVAELTDSLPWKWWRPKTDVDWQNVKVELVDILHFWTSLCQIAGLSARDVYEAYIKKNEVNHQRQDTGYVVKDEDDCRHI